MSAKINLNDLSLDELKQLQKDAANAVTSFEERKRAEVIAELEAVAKAHGYMLSELMGGKKAKVAAPAKYCHPQNSAKTWLGRGRQPGWIKEALAAGKSLEDFAI